ncbi:MAG: hypothetical protein Q8L85_06330 [Alphaproteobacteria bacterium]|nr:hypothetical protein [Alphaproteobacteria bacterium]
MKKTVIFFFFLLASHSLMALVEWPSFTNQVNQHQNQISVDWLLEHLLQPLQHVGNREAAFKSYQNYAYKIQKRRGFVPVLFEQLQDSIMDRNDIVELKPVGDPWNEGSPTNWMNYKLYINDQLAQEEVIVIGRWEIINN